MKTKIIAMVALAVISIFVCGLVIAQENNIVTASSNPVNAANLLNNKGIKINDADSEEVSIKLRWSSKILRNLATNAYVNTSVSRNSFGDIIKAIKAANKLMGDTFNPDTLNIRGLNLKDGVLFVTYEVGQTKLTVGVDMLTLEAGFDKEAQRYADAALKTREDTAAKMGVNIEEVHINGIQALMHIIKHGNNLSTLLYLDPYPKYSVTARVGNYTLTLDYTEYIDLQIYYYGQDDILIDGPINDSIIKPWPPYRRTVITLTSFVDNNTGRNYVAEAKNKVLDLLNPEFNNIGVAYWSMIDGVLRLNIDLYNNNYPYGKEFIRLGGNIPVEVNLSTGEIRIDERIVDAVTKTRQEISQKLNVNMSEVHVNSIYEEWPIHILDVYPPKPIMSLGYIISASTEKFNLTFRYDFNTSSIALTSLVNRETGQDLYKNAVEYLMETANPETFELVEWRIKHVEQIDSGIILGETAIFSFRLLDGSEIWIGVDVKTGNAYMPSELREALLNTRADTAARMGVDIKEVHINSVETLNLIHPCDAIYWDYALTARVNHFTLSFDYHARQDLMGNPPTYHIELKSLVNNDTGVDLYAKAVENLREKFNPQAYRLNGWKLTANNLAEFQFSLDSKSSIAVRVDMGSGVIREATYNEEDRLADGSLLKTQIDYSYDENGALKEEKFQSEAFNADGQLWVRCESDVKYDAAGNVTEGYQLDSYYSGGMLTQMSGVIGLSKDSAFSLYAVSYDIDASGNITATHVYDQNGNEILGGDGFINPLDIINQLKTGTKEIERNAEIVEADNNKFSEIMDRMAVQDEAAQQAADHRFVNEMAPKPELVQQPQAQ